MHLLTYIIQFREIDFFFFFSFFSSVVAECPVLGISKHKVCFDPTADERHICWLPFSQLSSPDALGPKLEQHDQFTWKAQLKCDMQDKVIRWRTEVGLVSQLFQPYMLGKQACFAGCAQTLPNSTPPTGRIHRFSKIAVTFEPVEPI